MLEEVEGAASVVLAFFLALFSSGAHSSSLSLRADLPDRFCTVARVPGGVWIRLSAI